MARYQSNAARRPTPTPRPPHPAPTGRGRRRTARPAAGPRRCDREARALLGPRCSTVFPAPARAAIGAADHADACARSRAAGGTGLSVQAFNLLPRIAELDRLLAADPCDAVVEAHPELAFLRLHGGGHLPPKRTVEGRAARLALAGPVLGPSVDLAAAARAARVPLVDVLDAAVKRKVYHGASAEQWPQRKAASAKQRARGTAPPPHVTLPNACSYLMRMPRTRLAERERRDAQLERERQLEARVAVARLGDAHPHPEHEGRAVCWRAHRRQQREPQVEGQQVTEERLDNVRVLAGDRMRRDEAVVALVEARVQQPVVERAVRPVEYRVVDQRAECQPPHVLPRRANIVGRVREPCRQRAESARSS